MQQPKLRFQRGPRSSGEREGSGQGRGGKEASPGAQKIGGVGVGRKRGPFFPTLRAGGEEGIEGKRRFGFFQRTCKYGPRNSICSCRFPI